MAAKESPGPSTSVSPPVVKPEIPPISNADVDVVHITGYSRWFSWDAINECEVKFLPEFFDSRSPSKNPGVYKYYRDSIIMKFRKNPSRKITFTDVRRTLVGDVGSIRRVFDFLETWGLINFLASVKPLKWEDKETKSSSSSVEFAALRRETSKRVCNGCKSLCTIACFACEKYDLTLCARCYVRGNYRVGVSSSDFRRVEISEETRTEWTEKETLLLLEAVLHYGDDWRKVAQHVPGRCERDCIIHFIKLPFGEEFIGQRDSREDDSKTSYMKNSGDAESELLSDGTASPSKRIRLTPLADASNPIMAQAAFLSAMAGVGVAEAAARAAVTTQLEVDNRTSKPSLGSLLRIAKHQEAEVASNADTTDNVLERFSFDANSLIEKERLDVEKAVTDIIETQMKEIQDKIVRFEKLDLQMEKEWQQLEEMKNMLFVDQLSLLLHKTSAPNIGDHAEDNRKTHVP
ncbi:SWI/SNF complex subunit SWI3B-like [Mangifera indica]|uniref:SWI/SNF complex subunit SWI3B-like n=1 Tax=Mangifera indica TaxID=29780 RepID=UPI001CF94FE5|nr:SWI/SNF complex subunit SWI3B-like [Mangifera indica]